ncbi:MAG: hypothetical protein ABEL97_04000 [Salinibacter sp.]
MPVSVLRFGLLLLLGLLSGGAAAHAQIEELPRPDSAHAASFGVSVALGDSIAVVGVSGASDCGPNSGAVYVYRRESGTVFDRWRGVARLTPRICRANTFFGERVVLSGRRLMVSAAATETFGAAGTNAAYMFVRDTTDTWRQTARFTAPSDRPEGSFAADIDLDGDRAVVSTSGAPKDDRNGAVYVYDYDAARNTWQRSARLTAGQAGPDAGVLGRAVALDGDHLAVAASTYFEGDPGSIYLFEHDGSQWRESTRLRGIDSFLIELALDGSTLLVGEDRAGGDGSGRATVYTTEQGQSWTRATTLQPSQPYESGAFGTAVSLEGPWALVTGYGEQLGKDFNIDRVVYVFRRREGRTWTERTILDIGQVDFGAALDQHGSGAIVSSVPGDAPGSVYVVQLR